MVIGFLIGIAVVLVLAAWITYAIFDGGEGLMLLAIMVTIFAPVIFGLWASTLSTTHHRQTFNRACEKAGGEMLETDSMVCIKKGFERITIVID